ncbi:hypothetical protein [Clostridium tertium]|uniref:hypothetical protein n=1 Tax=Clostridium tertium TaxID=1559 RepID=UPI0023B293A5|nr:hypothetical protein [Clostridium tertium]
MFNKLELKQIKVSINEIIGNRLAYISILNSQKKNTKIEQQLLDADYKLLEKVVGLIDNFKEGD